MTLHRRILVGLLAGSAVGVIARQPAMEQLRTVVLAIEPIGTVFIRLITMVVVPLVVASVFTGVASPPSPAERERYFISLINIISSTSSVNL